MTLPLDLTKWIEANFSPAEQSRAAQLLKTAVDHENQPAGDRLKRCAALASDGELKKLRYYIDQLRVDWRDVIVAGEYEPGKNLELTRVRDLNRPIT